MYFSFLGLKCFQQSVKAVVPSALGQAVEDLMCSTIQPIGRLLSRLWFAGETSQQCRHGFFADRSQGFTGNPGNIGIGIAQGVNQRWHGGRVGDAPSRTLAASQRTCCTGLSRSLTRTGTALRPIATRWCRAWLRDAASVRSEAIDQRIDVMDGMCHEVPVL